MSSDQCMNSEKHLEDDSNSNKTIKCSENSDINQNFLNSEKSSVKPSLPQFRGLNNLKPSPDSGWTFPSLANSPVIPHGVSPQSHSNFLSQNTQNGASATGNLHLPLKNTNELVCNNSFPLVDTFQTGLSPLVDMNFHQQQMLQQHYFQQRVRHFHNRNNIRFNNALTPSGSHSNTILTPSGHFSNNGFERNNEFLMKNKTDNVADKDVLDDEKTLPSFSSLTSSFRVKKSPHMHAPAQRNQFIPFSQKNHMRLPLINPNTAQYNNGELVNQHEEGSMVYHQMKSFPFKGNNTPISHEDNNKPISTAAVYNRPKRPTLLGKILHDNKYRNYKRTKIQRVWLLYDYFFYLFQNAF